MLVPQSRDQQAKLIKAQFVDWSIDDVSRSLSEDLDDTDKFADPDEQFWHRSFQSLFDEGGVAQIAYAIESSFPPMHAVEINTDKNYIVMSGYDGNTMLGIRPSASELASKKFMVSFDWDQQLESWMRSRLSIKLNAIDHAFATHTVKTNPFLFENLDDADDFADEEYWQRTFQSLIDEGGLAQVAHALRTHFPSDRVLDIGENYVTMAVTLEAGQVDDLRKLKIPFALDQTLQSWLRDAFIPALNKAEKEKSSISKERHPLFFEDTSPWGSEYKPWGWEAVVAPVVHGEIRTGDGLDDTDEFVTGDEDWQVKVTNRNIPGKELSGVVGWEKGEIVGHFPKIMSLDKNDFGISEDFAKKILWAAYWQAEEMQEGRTSYKPFKLDTYLVNIENDGMEMLKYINDPEHYGRNYQRDKTAGWTNIGTHTYGEQLLREENVVNIQGRPFTPLREVDLMNLQMGAWHWLKPEVAPDVSDFLYSDAETIAGRYPRMFIWWAPALDLWPFYNQGEELPPHEGPDLDDRDEFEDDDPEIDLQRWEDAERMGASAARDKMFEDAASLEPAMRTQGLELLFVGAAPGRDRKRELRPFIVVGRKAPMAEALEDTDEFHHPLDMIPVSATIIYNPLEIDLSQQEVIEVAKMMVVEAGYHTGDFTVDKPIWQPDYGPYQVRIFGKMEVHYKLNDWLEDEGGRLEFSTGSPSDLYKKYGKIVLILESQGAWLRHHGIDA